METINNKTLEKLKYELVRDGIVSYETLEKAEELANVQNINIGQAMINSGVLSEETLLNQVIEKQPSTQNFTKSINLTNERRKKEEERIAKELQWQETLKAIAENRVTPLDLEEINLRASQKEPKAIEVLAWMYTKGVGVQKDFVAAFRLYRQAETLQVPQAKENAIKVYKAMDSHQREELSK